MLKIVNISRQQLASFLNNDQDLIRRFEELFTNVGESFPDEIESITLSASIAEASQNASIGDLINSMDRLSSAIGTLPAKPEKIEEPHDIKPSLVVQNNKRDDVEPMNQQQPIGVTDTFDNTDTRTITITQGIITEIT